MTTATFFSEGSRIVGFEIKGHTGHAPAGEDIVCAAVTSAVRLTEMCIRDRQYPDRHRLRGHCGDLHLDL